MNAILNRVDSLYRLYSMGTDDGQGWSEERRGSMSSQRDSGEVRPFRSTNPGDETMPRWFKQMVIGTIFAGAASFIVAIVVVSRWSATMEAKLDGLSIMMNSSVNEQGRRIKDLQDDVKLLDLRMQNLQRDYAVLNDRVERSTR